MLLAAARRFLALLALASVVTVAASLLFGALIGSPADRAVSVGFYLVGSFLLIGGFFMGNRGPLRLKNDYEASSLLPFWGSRIVRWATPEEQEQTINMSAIFVALGFALIMLGFAVDSRYTVF